MLGEPTKALECYYSAIRAAPDAPETYYNLGTLLHEQGRYYDKMEAFKLSQQLFLQQWQASIRGTKGASTKVPNPSSS